VDRFFFTVYPYIALTLFIVVPIVRYRFGGFRWSTRASGFFERPAMGIAAMCIHWGVLILLVGHTLGLIGGLATKQSWVDAFHWIGLAGGVIFFYGLCLALLRRIMVRELRVVSIAEDYIILVLLASTAFTGLYPVISDKTFGLSYSVGPWVREIFQLTPEVGAMAGLATISKIHLILAFTVIAYFPFTKLVHMWTLPLGYLTRPYQSMRTYRKVMS
jgi:nitrate reductase gamma subunit